MPFTKDTRVLASDFTSLRTAIKNEINARSHTGSIAGTFVDYTVDPAVIGIVQIEHYNKLVNGLKLINTTTAVSGLTKSAVVQDDSILASDLALVDSKKTTFVNFDLTSQSTTDCSTSCTGGCYDDCYSSCTSCSGTCEGTCDNTCDDTCDTGCLTTCYAFCADDCYGDCEGSCQYECGASCEGTCTGCDTTCTIVCASVEWNS